MHVDRPRLGLSLDAFRRHVKGFGAWEEEEIAAWSQDECNALFIQLVSGDIREAGLDASDPDWAEYEAGAEAGRYPGRIFRGDDGKARPCAGHRALSLRH